VALPVLTSNTSTGVISWTEFKVKYGTGDGTNGTIAPAEYPVSAGSTANKFVWWRFNNGAPVTESGNTIPSTFDWKNDKLLFLNKAGVAIYAAQASVVEGSLIVDESIYANAIAANQISAVKIATDAIETRHIKANQVTGVHILGGSISTEKLSVGSFASGNLAPNPLFEDWPVAATTPEGWGKITDTGFEGSTITRSTALTVTGALSMGMTADVGKSCGVTTTTFIPVMPGEDVFMEGYFAGTGALLADGFGLAIYFFDSAQNLLEVQTTTASITGGNTIDYISHLAAAPQTAKFLRPVLISIAPDMVVVDNITLGHRVSSVQIKDGAIKAEHIETESFRSVEIDADQIRADTVLGANIEVTGSLEARGNNKERVGLSGEGFYVYGRPRRTATITNKALTTNVATLTLSAAPANPIQVGDQITVSLVGAPFDGTWEVASVPTTTTVTFAVTGTNVTSVATFGTLSYPDHNPAAEAPKLIHFPTDGDQPNIIAGQLTSSTVVAEDGISMSGRSEVASGSTLEIAGAVTPPKNKPALTISDYEAFSYAKPEYYSMAGLTKGHDGNYWSSYWNTNTNSTWFGPLVGVIAFNSAGALVADKGLGVVSSDAMEAVMTTGIHYDATSSTYYVSRSSKQGGTTYNYIQGYNTAFTTSKYATRVAFTPSGGEANLPGIGWDHVNNKLLWGWYNVTSSRFEVKAFTINASTGALTADYTWNSPTYSADGYAATSAIIRTNSSDLGGDRFIIKTEQDDTWRVFGVTNNTGPYYSNESWPTAYGYGTFGGYYDTTRAQFIQINNGTTWYAYEKGAAYWTTTTAKTYSVGYTWASDQGVDYETNLGAVASYTPIKRARTKYSIDKIPTGNGSSYPNKARIYLAKTSGAYKRIAELGLGVTSFTWTGSTVDGTQTPPTGTTKAFPSTSAAKISSGSTRWDGTPMNLITGDGKGNLDGLIPPGTITMYGGATAPAGWALCNSTALNTVVNKDLFDVIGYTYGGSGTTFNTPDLRSRFPVGVGTYAARGDSDNAAETVRSPSHDHNVGTLDTNSTGSTHTHVIPNQADGTNFIVTVGSGTNSVPRRSDFMGHNHGGATTGTGSGHDHEVTGRTGMGAGNGAALESRFPYLGVNFIIKL
jgi:microcystin-dependent protein